MDITACIEACSACHRVCLAAVGECLKLGGEHADAAHLRLLVDCAEICETGANFMLRRSDHHAVICAACAEICERCAESCAALDSEAMRRCAEVCLTCAASCREMAVAA